MNDIVINVRNVSKTFRELIAVDNLCFKVSQSQCFSLLGPNGAGKSTMMKILYGKALRDKKTDDEVSIYGYDPAKHELEIKFISGIVPQENNLDEELSVYQNLLIYSKFYGMKKKQANEKIDELLNFMELGQKKNENIRALSGGMKRRLIIARALINNPKILILDEPTTGLDPQVRNLIWDKLRQLKKEGVTILLTTHYMEEAFQICDNIIILDKGKHILEGSPVELIKNNIESYVLEVFNVNELDGINIEAIKKEGNENRMLLLSNSYNELETIQKKITPGSAFLRQANLEDVFLKITGRKLDE